MKSLFSFCRLAITVLMMALLFPAYASTLKGRLKSPSGEGLGFATVYVSNSGKGTTTNFDGYYTLDLSPGQYNILFRYIGYKAITKVVNISAESQTLDVVLQPESVELKELVVKADAEDPAYPIIREAIKRREYYQNEVPEYACEGYAKTIARMLKNPAKFVHVTINNKEAGVLDSASKIQYLAESISKVYVKRPDKVKEEMVSSHVSGEPQGFSFNKVSAFNFDVYENRFVQEGINDRGFITPIASDALFYYKYHLLGSFVENGKTVYKIQLIPKRRFDPVFRGVIYILDSAFRVHSADIYLIKDAQMALIDTFKIRQTYTPVSGNIWQSATTYFSIDVTIFGFHEVIDAVAVRNNYNLKPQFGPKFFTNEIMKINDDANTKDSSYWSTIRPVPLTKYEVKDYHMRDSVVKHQNTKAYMDSTDRKNNRFKPRHLLLGHTYTHSFDKSSFTLKSLLGNFRYDPVEGLYMEAGINRFKWFGPETKNISWEPSIGYGFANKQITGRLSFANVFNPKNSESFSFTMGDENVQYNPKGVPVLFNTVYALFLKENYLKLYRKQYIRVEYKRELWNGLYLTFVPEYAQRRALINHTNYAFGYPNADFAGNDPLNESNTLAAFPLNRALSTQLVLRYVPGQTYTTRPGEKMIEETKGVSYLLDYRKGYAGISDVNYDLLSLTLEDNFSLGLLGTGNFKATAGKFFNNKKMFFMDYQHFLGTQMSVTSIGLSRFMALPDYQYSSNAEFAEAHYEHNFGGFFLNKFPLIRRLKLREIAAVHFLSDEKLNRYWEVTLGAQKGIIPVRVLFVTSFADKQHVYTGLRVSLPF